MTNQELLADLHSRLDENIALAIPTLACVGHCMGLVVVEEWERLGLHEIEHMPPKKRSVAAVKLLRLLSQRAADAIEQAEGSP